MAESHVISGLVKKRRDLKAEHDYIIKQAETIRKQIVTLDDAIKIIEPEYDLRTIKPKKHQPSPDRFKIGETSQMVLDFLRESDTPLSVDRLTDMIIDKKGVQLDSTAKYRLKSRISKSLQRYEQREVVDSGEGGYSLCRDVFTSSLVTLPVAAEVA